MSRKSDLKKQSSVFHLMVKYIKVGSCGKLETHISFSWPESSNDPNRSGQTL